MQTCIHEYVSIHPSIYTYIHVSMSLCMHVFVHAHIYKYIHLQTYMSLYIYVCITVKFTYECMYVCPQMYSKSIPMFLYTYDMSRNKYYCHIANMSHSPIILNRHIDKTFSVLSKHNKLHYLLNILLPCKCPQQICISKGTYMPHMQTISWMIMLNVSSLWSTVWPQTLVYIYFTLFPYALENTPATFHLYAPVYCNCNLHIEPTLLDISEKRTKCDFNLPCFGHISAKNKYDPQMPNICHMTKSFRMHMWGKCANIYVTYEFNGINMWQGSAVHRNNDNNDAIAQLH